MPTLDYDHAIDGPLPESASVMAGHYGPRDRPRQLAATDGTHRVTSVEELRKAQKDGGALGEVEFLPFLGFDEMNEM